MKLTLPCLLAALAAGPALSDCLTAKNVADGIRVTFENGDVTTVRSLGADMYQVEETYSEGTQHIRYHALYSTYNLWYAPLLGGVQQDSDATRVDWGVDPTELPLPAADAPVWTGPVVEYDAMGQILDGALREVRFSADDPIVLGDCSYETVTVGVSTTWKADPHVQLQFWSYLPELGISFIVGWSPNADTFVETTVTQMEPM